MASFVRMLISKTLDISTEVPRRTTCPPHLRPVRRMLHQVRQPMMHRAPCQANDNLDGDCQRHWGKERDTLMKRVVGINILINNIPIRIRTWPGETDPNPNLGRRNRSESEPGPTKPIRIRTWQGRNRSESELRKSNPNPGLGGIPLTRRLIRDCTCPCRHDLKHLMGGKGGLLIYRKTSLRCGYMPVFGAGALLPRSHFQTPLQVCRLVKRPRPRG